MQDHYFRIVNPFMRYYIGDAWNDWKNEHHAARNIELLAHNCQAQLDGTIAPTLEQCLGLRPGESIGRHPDNAVANSGVNNPPGGGPGSAGVNAFGSRMNAQQEKALSQSLMKQAEPNGQDQEGNNQQELLKAENEMEVPENNAQEASENKATGDQQESNNDTRTDQKSTENNQEEVKNEP